jgi:hypothetical protein
VFRRVLSPYPVYCPSCISLVPHARAPHPGRSFRFFCAHSSRDPISHAASSNFLPSSFAVPLQRHANLCGCMQLRVCCGVRHPCWPPLNSFRAECRTIPRGSPAPSTLAPPRSSVQTTRSSFEACMRPSYVPAAHSLQRLHHARRSILL